MVSTTNKRILYVITALIAIAVIVFGYNKPMKKREEKFCRGFRCLGKGQNHSSSKNDCVPCPDTNDAATPVKNGATSDRQVLVARRKELLLFLVPPNRSMLQKNKEIMEMNR